MVLQGLSTTTYIGWLYGVLFLKSPKGIPIFPPSKSLYNVYAIVVYIVMTAVGIDFHFRNLKALKNESAVDRFLGCSLFIGATIFDLYFRACFFFRGKIVVRFLKSLETDMNKIPLLQIPPEDRKTWKNYTNLVMFVKVYQYLGAVFTSVWVATALPPDTRLFGFISSSIYPVVYLVLGFVPLISSTIVAFSFVVVTTIHIQWIFDDFCIYFEEQLAIHEKQNFNPMKRDLGEIYAIPSSKTGTNEQILNKFEHLKLLCSQYDKISGPLLMGLLVRAVFVLISSANTMLLYNGTSVDKRVKLFLNVYYFASEMSQLVLLQLGYMIHRRFSERKEQLHRKVILMTNLVLRDQMKEAINVISDWNWSVSGGPGFFHVDRPLLSGVLSSLMTYVTILFQLDVATTTDESSISNVTRNNSDSGDLLN